MSITSFLQHPAFPCRILFTDLSVSIHGISGIFSVCITQDCNVPRLKHKEKRPCCAQPPFPLFYASYFPDFVGWKISSFPPGVFFPESPGPHLPLSRSELWSISMAFPPYTNSRSLSSSFIMFFISASSFRPGILQFLQTIRFLLFKISGFPGYTFSASRPLFLEPTEAVLQTLPVNDNPG